MKNLFLLVTTACIIAVSACTHKKNSVVSVNSQLKEAFDFKPGTYWIYKDSISGIIDSYYVTNNIDVNAQTGSNVLEYITIPIQVAEYGTSAPLYGDTLRWELDYEDNMIMLSYNEQRLFEGDVRYAPLINYPYLDCLLVCGGCIVKPTTDSSKVLNINNSYQIAGHTFSNVAEVYQHTNIPVFRTYQAYTVSDYYYMCPEIGIIKMKLDHPRDTINRVWELQRWNIVK